MSEGYSAKRVRRPVKPARDVDRWAEAKVSDVLRRAFTAAAAELLLWARLV